MVAQCNVEKQVRRVTSRSLSSHDRPKTAVRSGPKARPRDPKKNDGRVEFIHRVTRFPFLFRGILLRPQESRSDGVCATNLAIQGHPPPGIRTWVIRHTDSGGLETKFEFAGGLADSTETEKQGTIEHRNGKTRYHWM